MYLRAHISLYAVGCVVLLGVDLLGGSGSVWADTAIGAWGMLIIAHGILMIIARLLQELLADDEGPALRPASEMQWRSSSTWTLPPRMQRASTSTRTGATSTPFDATPVNSQPDASRDTPRDEPADPSPDSSERVSWQEATNAAWRAPRDASPASGSDKDDDDIIPLRFD
jgi:hypothetical protein